MLPLNFPAYEFSIRRDGPAEIFDPLRKKFVALTPEEWVRQHMVRYLTEEKGFPHGLLSVEGSITLYRTKKRYDIAAFDRNGSPILVVECKAPSVPVNEKVVDQVIRYNLVLEAPYLLVTNGLVHVALKKEGGSYVQFPRIPDFSHINAQP